MLHFLLQRHHHLQLTTAFPWEFENSQAGSLCSLKKFAVHHSVGKSRKKSIVDVLEVLAKCKLLPEIWAFPTISVAIVA